MTHEIAVIPGDGIGQEVTPAAVEVLEAIDGVDFDFVEGEAGDAVKEETGDALPEETRELAADADATLVVDEVYHHFDYSGRFESALTLGEVRETIAVTCSFSKSLAITGFRVGYTVLPERLVDHATTRHMLVNVAASRPAQAAVLRALRETGPEYYEQTRETLRERVATFCDALDAAGFAYTDPDGAFYVLAKVDGLPGTVANTERLIDEAGVAPMPGATFGEAYADWFRFALVTPRVETAAERLREWADARDAA